MMAHDVLEKGRRKTKGATLPDFDVAINAQVMSALRKGSKGKHKDIEFIVLSDPVTTYAKTVEGLLQQDIRIKVRAFRKGVPMEDYLIASKHHVESCVDKSSITTAADGTNTKKVSP
jgi:hypothetical protein